MVRLPGGGPELRYQAGGRQMSREHETKALTMLGILSIVASSLVWVGFARSAGPSVSIPDWLNPPTEPAR